MSERPPDPFGGRVVKAAAALTIACALSAIASDPALALGYSCRNADFEISCRSGKCSASDGFTPMGVDLDTRTRSMSACAYSGCWKGRAAHVIVTRTHVVAHGLGLKPNSPQLRPESAALVIDRETSSASFSGFGFQNPMTCSVGR